MSQKDLKDLGCFVINLLNNKTIILLNLSEYRLSLADEAVLSIRRYSARFRRIIVNYLRAGEVCIVKNCECCRRPQVEGRLFKPEVTFFSLCGPTLLLLGHAVGNKIDFGLFCTTTVSISC